MDDQTRRTKLPTKVEESAELEVAKETLKDGEFRVEGYNEEKGFFWGKLEGQGTEIPIEALRRTPQIRNDCKLGLRHGQIADGRRNAGQERERPIKKTIHDL